MNQLKPNEQRAKNAIIVTWILLAVTIVSLFSSLLQYNLLQNAIAGEYISDEAANANDLRETIIGIAGACIYLISLIIFILWFRRAYFNLHKKVNHLRHSEGWAAGSWFVPIVCFYLPYQIMKEIYIETKKLFVRRGLSEKVNYTTSYLGWWWFLWLITVFIANYILKFTFRYAETIDEYIKMTTLEIIQCTLEIPLALLTIKIIRDYSKVESYLNEIDDEYTVC